MKTKYTDYNNCLVNVSASILKHFGVKWDKEGISEIDRQIVGKKKVVIMLLDGMGINTIKHNLGNDSFLNTHITKTINSVFPPTTVAATTSVLTGLNPIEHGWLGWHLYLNKKAPSLILFRNEDYYKKKPYHRLNVNDVLGYKSIIDMVREKGVKGYEIYPSFKKDGYKTFKEALEHLEHDILTKDETSLTYFYWDEPDASIHEKGTTDIRIKSIMHYFNDRIEDLNEVLDKDTIVFVIADHGLVDVEPICINEFKDLKRMLRKKMSGEGRAAIFHVKENRIKDFEILFDYYFDEWFDLYTKEEVLKNNIYGDVNLKHHKSLEYSLGDYVAIAKDKYYFTYDLSHVFKGHHAGGVKEETEIPLIILGGK